MHVIWIHYMLHKLLKELNMNTSTIMHTLRHMWSIINSYYILALYQTVSCVVPYVRQLKFLFKLSIMLPQYIHSAILYRPVKLYSTSHELYITVWCFMMTSSNGNIFRVTGFCAGNSPVPGEFPALRPVTRSFDVFFDLRLNKRLSKQ